MRPVSRPKPSSHTALRQPAPRYGLRSLLLTFYALISSILLFQLFRGHDQVDWLPFLLTSQAWNLCFLGLSLFFSQSTQRKLQELAIQKTDASPTPSFFWRYPKELFNASIYLLYALGWITWGLPLGGLSSFALFVGGSFLLFLFTRDVTQRAPRLTLVAWYISLALVLLLPTVSWSWLVWLYAGLLLAALVPLFAFGITTHAHPRRSFTLDGDHAPRFHLGRTILSLGLGLLLLLPPLLAQPQLPSMRIFAYARSPQTLPIFQKDRTPLLQSLHQWPPQLHRSQSETFHRLHQDAPSLDKETAYALLKILASQQPSPQSTSSSRLLLAPLLSLTETEYKYILDACKQEPRAAFLAQKQIYRSLIAPPDEEYASPPRTTPAQITLLRGFQECLPKKKRLDLSVLWVLLLGHQKDPVAKAAQHALSLSSAPSPQTAYQQAIKTLPYPPSQDQLIFTFLSIAQAKLSPSLSPPPRLKELLQHALQSRSRPVSLAALQLVRKSCTHAFALLPLLHKALSSTNSHLRLRALDALYKAGTTRCRPSQSVPTAFHPAFSYLLQQQKPTSFSEVLFRMALEDPSPALRKKARRVLLLLNTTDLQPIQEKLFRILEESNQSEQVWLLAFLLRFPTLPPTALPALFKLLQHSLLLIQQTALESFRKLDIPQARLFESIQTQASQTPLYPHLVRLVQSRLSPQQWLLQQAAPQKEPRTNARLERAFIRQMLRLRALKKQATSRPTSTSRPSSNSATSRPFEKLAASRPSTQQTAQDPLQLFQEQLYTILQEHRTIEHYKARLKLLSIMATQKWSPEDIVEQVFPMLYPPLTRLDQQRKRTHLFLLRLIGKLGPHAAPALPVLRRLLATSQTPHQRHIREVIAQLLYPLRKEAAPMQEFLFQHYRKTYKPKHRYIDLLMIARLGDPHTALELLRRESTVPRGAQRLSTWQFLAQQTIPQDGFLLPLLLDTLSQPASSFRAYALEILDRIDPKARAHAIQQRSQKALSSEQRAFFLLLQQRYPSPPQK
ncbi:MAG: hypothetical protein H6728_15320 [Myxococcales bacterium]|nr:hypothetical protein [Myxococcales bacterium]